MDSPLLKAMGYNNPPKALQRAIDITMQIRSVTIRFLPSRKEPYLGTKVKRATYPKGYKIEEIGTFPENIKGNSLGE
jgi:hypothetical protein